MKKAKRNVIAVLSVLALVGMGAGVHTAVSASADETQTATFSGTTSVSFRLTGDYGLRFKTTVDASVYQSFIEDNESATTGILVIPTDLLSGELDLANTTAANGVTYDFAQNIDTWEGVTDGETETSETAVFESYEAYAYIEEIPELSYTRNLTIRSYYTVNGTTTYTDPVTTSLTCVSQDLLTENANETILTNEQAAAVQGFVKDYTVVFQNGETGAKVAEKVSPATAKATKPDDADMVQTGFDFDGWYVGEETFDFENTVLTGDVLITARYVAPLNIDFSNYTSLPSFVTGNYTPIISEGYLTTKSQLWTGDNLSIAYKDVALQAGDTITITYKGNGTDHYVNLYVNDNTTNSIGWFGTPKNTDETSKEIKITSDHIKNIAGAEATELKLSSLKLSANSNPTVVSIKSVKLHILTDEERYAPLSLDFSDYESVPYFVTSSSALVIEEGCIKAQSTIAKYGYISIAYNDVALSNGDIITIVLSTTDKKGCNVLVNGTTWAGSEMQGWFNGEENGNEKEHTCTFNITDDMTLKMIRFLNTMDGTNYKIKSVVITKAN